MIDFLEQLKRKIPKKHEIIGRDKYFNAAVMITLVLKNGDYHFLFEKRASSIRQGGEISFPGGGYELDDKDFEATAIRETCEELGVRPEQIQVLGGLGTYLGRQGVIIEPYVGVLTLDGFGELEPDPAEVEKIFMVPVQFFIDHPPEKYAIRLEQQPYYINEQGKQIDLLPAAQLGLPEKYHKPWSGQHMEVYFYHVENEWIWGITAELIVDVIQRVLGI